MLQRATIGHRHRTRHCLNSRQLVPDWATVAATRADARAAGLFEVEEFEQRALEVFLQRVWKHAEILAEEVIVPGKDLIH